MLSKMKCTDNEQPGMGQLPYNHPDSFPVVKLSKGHVENNEAKM